ncbi:MAG: tetratricopeptide repeat protein [Limisphaerales bacterium]
MSRQRFLRKVPIVAVRRPQRWPVAMVCLALAAVTFAVFRQTQACQFIDLDDDDYVYHNAAVAGGLTLKGIVWAFSFHCYNWHPLTWLSHMLDCQLYGLRPGGHHLTSVLLHTVSVIALFLLLRQMTGALWRSAFVAAVFAIHPLRVESVAWVAERKDVLSGLFFMLTIAAYVRYARRPWSFARYGLVLLLFALGLMCKPMLVTLPAVLLLLDYWPLQRVKSRKPLGLVLEKLPLLALSAASCVVTLLAQHKAIQLSEAFSLPLRLANAMTACMVYLGQMVWPSGLAVLYPYPHSGLPAWKVALAGMLLAGLSALAWAQRRRQPWMLVGWLWYLLMLLPVAGLIQVGNQAYADRYTYLPQIGLYIALTWLAGALAAKRQGARVALAFFMSALLAALMICAWKQTAYWKDSETLWRHTLACTTDNYTARFSLANALSRQADGMDEAISQYQQALQIKPDFPEAHLNLGNALFKEGRTDEAISQYQLALQFQPDSADTHVDLGNALVQQNKLDEAISQYQRALQIDPTHPGGLNNLAWLMAASPQASLRNGSKAVELARKASAATGGNDPFVLHTLAAALAEAGRFSEAVETAQRALQLAGAQSNSELAAQLQLETKLYRAGSSYHDTAQTFQR